MKLTKPNKILILHGWEGNPNLYWFPLAKKKFEELGYEVLTPQMPGGYFPKKDNWLKIIEKINPGEDWILIGHSLGGVTILNYLEKPNRHVAQVILVAAPFGPMKFDPIANFFEGGFDWEKIKKNCENFVVLNESNDSVVPVEHGERLAKELGVKVHVVPGYSHFHTMDLENLVKLVEKK